MTPGTSFAALMRRLEAGDAEAAALVYGRFCRRLLGLTRRQLHDRLRSKVDADDVVQSVFRTFFRRAAAREFDLDGEGALWALLAEITLRKCGRWSRHFAARKRGGLRAAPALDADGEGGPADPREPSPADAAALVDLVEQLLRGLGERERLICQLRLQGYEVAEIADQAGCSVATVFRKLDLIKSRLRRLLPEANETGR
jgi:RNA polymerase sigma-70 factor (ECF subfamily)